MPDFTSRSRIEREWTDGRRAGTPKETYLKVIEDFYNDTKPSRSPDELPRFEAWHNDALALLDEVYSRPIDYEPEDDDPLARIIAMLGGNVKIANLAEDGVMEFADDKDEEIEDRPTL